MRTTYLTIAAVAALGLLALGILAISVGYVQCHYNDRETSTNLLTDWVSVLWNQTTQSDFNAGVLNNVDNYSSPDDIKLYTWYNPSWSYRKKITIDHTKVAGNLTDFPVLINLSSDADLASYARDEGYDILFTSANGTSKLDYERESFDWNTGKLIAWVRVPILSSTTDTVLYMYFGNPGAADQQNGPGVWDGNYAAVYHMSQSPAGTIYDSTSNHLNLTSYGGMGGSNLVSGRIGNAITFDGTNDRLTSSLTFTTTSFTFEAWVSNNNTGYWGDRSGSKVECILDIYNLSDPDKFYRVVSACPQYIVDYGMIGLSGKSTETIIMDRQSGTAWHHIVANYSEGNPGPRGYLNGAITTYTPTASWPSVTAQVAIGAWAKRLPDWNDFWWGRIDEVRISKISRTSSWISTEYQNENSPSTFYTVGARESSSTSGTIASQVLDTGITGAPWDFLFWSSITVAGTSITFEVRASDTSFAKNAASPSWTSVGGTTPITSGLPGGRYKQWRATLTTTDAIITPVLHEVRTWYS